MAGKTIVCRCEDVTLADVEEAIEKGYLDIEEVKRYTGLGTGPCQGRECLVPVSHLLAAARRRDPQRTARQPEAPRREHPFTVRPPLFPVALGLLARGQEAAASADAAGAADREGES